MTNNQKCIYCGRKALTTRDHVPPKCIFPKSSRQGLRLITVPACKKCNCVKFGQKMDEKFKDYLNWRCNDKGNTHLQKFRKSCNKTLSNNKKLKNEVAEKLEKTPHGLVINIKSKDVILAERMIKRMIRAMFYHVKNRAIAKSVVIEVSADVAKINQHMDLFKNIKVTPTNINVDKNIFYANYQMLSKNNNFSLWEFCFYNSYKMWGVTYIKDHPKIKLERIKKDKL